MAAQDSQLVFREIKPGDTVTGLSFGNVESAPLKQFLRKDALDFHLKNIAKTYVLAEEPDPSRVWAYATLMCSEIALGPHRIEDCQSANRYKVSPAVKLVRLAVDQRIKGQGYGKYLVNVAITIARDQIMRHVGCRFLCVDSKPSAVSFYEEAGFTILDTAENKASKAPILFLDLHKIPSG